MMTTGRSDVMEDLVPIGSLNYRTKNNLKWLESQGFSFGDMARRETIYRRNQRLRDEARAQIWAAHGREFPKKRGMSYYARSYYIDGYDPEGNPITYCRKETQAPGAGSTHIKTPYGNIRLRDYKRGVEGRPLVRQGRVSTPDQYARQLEDLDSSQIDLIYKRLKRRAEPKTHTYTSKGALKHYFPSVSSELEMPDIPTKKEMVQIWKAVSKDKHNRITKRELATGFLRNKIKKDFPEVSIDSPVYQFIWESLVESEDLGEYLRGS